MNFQDPKKFAIKKFVYSILGTDWDEEIIERISSSLVTDKDINSFCKMLNTVYDKGFHKAVEDYKKELTRLGVKINIQVKKNKVENL